MIIINNIIIIHNTQRFTKRTGQSKQKQTGTEIQLREGGFEEVSFEVFEFLMLNCDRSGT